MKQTEAKVWWISKCLFRKWCRPDRSVLLKD